MFYLFNDCVALLRTLRVLQHDPAKPQDLDTASEDHVADEVTAVLADRGRAPFKRPRYRSTLAREARDDMVGAQSSVKLL
jgi:hypothetical protein